MHLMSANSLAVLLCASNALIILAQDSNKDDQRAFNKPATKKQGKLPRWSFDAGPFKMESFFQEHKLEDRLRLSKSYIKTNLYLRNGLFGKKTTSGDPFISIKYSRYEELINCQNLTTLVDPEKEPLIDCRRLEDHTEDETFVSPVVDLSITQYVRRSSFRLKQTGTMTGRQDRHDLLIYPLKREVVLANIKSYVAENNLGTMPLFKPFIDRGYHVHFDIGSSNSPLVITCIGDVYLSINRTKPGYVRQVDDPYPEYLDAIEFLFSQARENGYLFSLQGFKCKASDLLSHLGTLDIDFTIMQKQKFPYLFVRHKMITSPLSIFLDYDAKVEQIREKATSKPESYNTKVSINSSSALIPVMNFKLQQSIDNEDFMTGSEHATLINQNIPIIVASMWNENMFFKHFRFVEVVKELSGIDLENPQFRDLLNISLHNDGNRDDIMLTANIKKELVNNFSWDNLYSALGLDGAVYYDTTPEDEKTVREEL